MDRSAVKKNPAPAKKPAGEQSKVEAPLTREELKKLRIAEKKRVKLLTRVFGIVMVLMAVALLAAAVCYRQRAVAWLLGLAGLIETIPAAQLLRKKTTPFWLYGVIGAVCIGLAFCAGPAWHYVFLGNSYVPDTVTECGISWKYPSTLGMLSSLETIDMHNSTVTDFTPLSSISTLKQVDVRGNYAFTQTEYDRLHAALPDCEILWSVPVAGTHFDSDLSVYDLTGESLSNDELRQVIADSNGVPVLYEVDVLGAKVRSDETAVTLTAFADTQTDALNEALSMLPSVGTVDLSAVPVSAETVGKLIEANPGVGFALTFDAPDASVTPGATELTFTEGSMEDVLASAAFFPYMSALEKLDIRALSPTTEQVDEILALKPGLKIDFDMEVFGTKINSFASYVNLDGRPISDPESVATLVSHMPELKQIDMNKCGLSDTQMAALRERFPEVKFVWTVTFATYEVRTDATVFSTNLYSNNKFGYTQETFAPLVYCTELKFLDLGHCRITDISFVATFKDLRVLILADNRFTDLSPIQDLEYLEYVEIFLCKGIKDYSPLANKTHLIDLNVNCNKITDITPFLTLTNLERLWVGETGLSDHQLRQLKNALPDCKVTTRNGGDSTGAGWRDHKRYKVIKQMYKTNEYIPFD